MPLSEKILVEYFLLQELKLTIRFMFFNVTFFPYIINDFAGLLLPKPPA